jgi:hypothetical protein
MLLSNLQTQVIEDENNKIMIVWVYIVWMKVEGGRECVHILSLLLLHTLPYPF